MYQISVLNFLRMRTLITAIAHDPSAVYFPGLIKKKKEVTIFKAYAVW